MTTKMECFQQEMIESSTTSQLTDMTIEAIIENPIKMLPMTSVRDDESKTLRLPDSQKVYR